MTISENTKLTVGALLIVLGAYAWLNSKFNAMELRQVTTDTKVEAVLMQQRTTWTRADMILWTESMRVLNPTIQLPKVERQQ